jgi:hypothetical protein
MLYQQAAQPEALFGHIFGEDEGFLVAFSGQQARICKPDARANELVAVRQLSFRYPDRARQAADYLLDEAHKRQGDAYVAVHLFRKAGSRLASNAVGAVSCLWMDEDEGAYPDIGPEPTAVVASSSTRRHLYWRLAHPVSVEWAVQMNRRIAMWANGDVGKAGLATVLRVPGTKNFKRHPQVDEVTMTLTGSGPWEPEIMEQAIPPLPEPSTVVRTGSYDGPEVEIEEYLQYVEVFGEVSDGLGIKFAIACPWLREHSGKDCSGTYVGQRAGGGPWFHCNHDHCYGRTWQDFKRAVRRTVRLRLPTPTNTKRGVLRLD